MTVRPLFPSLLPFGVLARRLDSHHEAEVVAFCAQCSAFFTLVMGECSATDAARNLMESRPQRVEASRKHVIGFECGGALVAIVDVLEGFPDESDWYVGLLLLSPDARGHGLGSEIWKAVEAWIYAAGGRQAKLIVQEQNPDGAAFWRAAGFTTDGTVEQHLLGMTNLCWRFEKSLRVPSSEAPSTIVQEKS